jgi:hypothetical protein
MHHQKYSQGFIAILGSLIVLSGFMLVFGVTTTMAQTGQDEDCLDYTGKARGLCTAAISEGCFDGVESQECDDLTTNWNDQCKSCEGPAPWVTCPCAEAVGSTMEMNEIYEDQIFEGVIDTFCTVEGEEQRETSVTRSDQGGFTPFLVLRSLRIEGGFFCDYRVTDNQPIEFFRLIRSAEIEFTSPDEHEACQKDIKALQAVSGLCP